VSADVYRRQAEAMAKLVVTYHTPGVLAVDALALTHDEHDVRFWLLRPVDGQPGVWLHPQSGESGPVSELLRGIADSYLDRRAAGVPQEGTDHG